MAKRNSQDLRRQAGNIGMMFGLFLIPLVLAGGIAIDFLNLQRTRTDLSQAVDGAILAAARAKAQKPSLTTRQIEDIAWKFFVANAQEHERVHVARENFVMTHGDSGDGSSYMIRIDGGLDTQLLSIVGRDILPINIVTEARQGTRGRWKSPWCWTTPIP